MKTLKGWELYRNGVGWLRTFALFDGDYKEKLMKTTTGRENIAEFVANCH